ncbi:MAG TPA: plastocyanin/azurin family copper-binding protein [Gemmatimonadaceae bacterium]|nr:plastocyanin/azurin family copper-binding protein [Gemmatimonadaceae bacterium]
MADYIEHDHTNDGVDRKGFLKCMAWAGTGVVWALVGGVPKSYALSSLASMTEAQKKEIFFAQISDSHIGFSKEANKDVTATLQLAVDRLNAVPKRPAFVLHTGDISQLSKPGEFDTAAQVIRGIRTDSVFYVPGEHDVLTDNGAQYLARFGNKSEKGYYSFDHSGARFIGLVNVMNLKAGGLGSLGAEQIEWLKRDVQGLSSSTPIVIFAHIPMWAVYPTWGWGTDDSAQALALLKRFGSVTVLNGHIHQTLQKVEGNVRFHSAFSTAFPQPAPGTAPSPGPMTVDADKLKSVLGVCSVAYVPGAHTLAIVDSTLDGEAVVAGATMAGMSHTGAKKSFPKLPPNSIGIDNFSFEPKTLTVAAGTTVTWVNRDDVPHLIISTTGKFPNSKVLDTDQVHTATFDAPGEYPYFCSIHPTMVGKVVVR